MIWTSIIMYRMALQYAEQYKQEQEKEQQEQLPQYEAVPPSYEHLFPIG